MTSNLRICVIGPAKSGKTSFCERLAFPEGEYVTPYDGHTVTTPIVTNIDDLEIIDCPDGYHVTDDDKCDRVVVLINRSEDKWKPYVDSAIKVYGSSVYLVFSLLDSNSYKRGSVSVRSDAYKVSSKTGEGFESLRKFILSGTHRVSRKRKVIITDDGWNKPKHNNSVRTPPESSIKDPNRREIPSTYNLFDLLN